MLTMNVGRHYDKYIFDENDGKSIHIEEKMVSNFIMITLEKWLIYENIHVQGCRKFLQIGAESTIHLSADHSFAGLLYLDSFPTTAVYSTTVQSKLLH